MWINSKNSSNSVHNDWFIGINLQLQLLKALNNLYTKINSQNHTLHVQLSWYATIQWNGSGRLSTMRFIRNRHLFQKLMNGRFVELMYCSFIQNRSRATRTRTEYWRSHAMPFWMSFKLLISFKILQKWFWIDFDCFHIITDANTFRIVFNCSAIDDNTI